MKLYTLKTIMLAFAGLALIVSSAKAATLTYNDGDLFIGFNNGGSQDYLIDVGQASQFTTSSQFTLSLGGTGTDLSSIFGGSWFGSSTVQWGAAGATTFGNGPAAANTVWATRTSTTPWANSFDQSTPTGALATIGGNFNGSGSTANSNFALLEATSNGASWASFESVANGGTGNAANSSTSGSLSGYFQPGIMGLTNQKLYLTELTEGSTNPGQAIGFFQIASNGQVSFTGASAAPEPSSYALMVLGGAVLFFAIKFGRRSELI
jgi:hypothetical protein